VNKEPTREEIREASRDAIRAVVNKTADDIDPEGYDDALKLTGDPIMPGVDIRVTDDAGLRSGLVALLRLAFPNKNVPPHHRLDNVEDRGFMKIFLRGIVEYLDKRLAPIEREKDAVTHEMDPHEVGIFMAIEKEIKLAMDQEEYLNSSLRSSAVAYIRASRIVDIMKGLPLTTLPEVPESMMADVVEKLVGEG
jgi:hypothetical protein